MTCANASSFDTRLSDRNVPPGPENSVTRDQNCRSSSRSGSASPRGRDVGVTHSTSAQTATVRIPSLIELLRVTVESIRLIEAPHSVTETGRPENFTDCVRVDPAVRTARSRVSGGRIFDPGVSPTESRRVRSVHLSDNPVQSPDRYANDLPSSSNRSNAPSAPG